MIDEHPSVRGKAGDLSLEGVGFPWFLRNAPGAEKDGGNGAVAGACSPAVDCTERAL